MREKIVKMLAPLLVMLLAISCVGIIPAAAEDNFWDTYPFDPADREKKVVYISTLSELLSYTFDFYEDYGIEYQQYKLYNEYTLVLTKDLDLETDTSWHEYAPDWETRGWPARHTCANIEGAGHTIFNLWGRPDVASAGPGTQVGLFSYLYSNYVQNLNIEYDSSKMAQAPEQTNVDRLAFQGYYGGLSSSSNDAHISNVHVKGDFHMGGGAGGIVEWAISSTIEHCSFEGNLSGSDVGGIVSLAANTSIKNSFFKGSITALSGGGIAHRPAAEKNIFTEIKNNVAIVTGITELDIGIYADDYRPWGSMFGQVIEDHIDRICLENNYILEVEGYPLATKSLGDKFNIGGPRYPIEYTETEVKGFDNITSFSEETNLPGLDFENEWYMDEEQGEPRLKRNRISVIDMTEGEWQDEFTVSTAERYYGEDDGAALVKGKIKDEDRCQLIYFTLDGQDVLGKIGLGSLPLFTDTSHVVVVKADGLCTANMLKPQGTFTIKVNGEMIPSGAGKYSFPYRMGETVTLEVVPEDGYEITEAKSGEGYELKEKDGCVYEVTFSGESTLTLPEVNLNIALSKVGGDGKPANNHTGWIVGVSVGGAVLIVTAAVMIIVTKRRKKF